MKFHEYLSGMILQGLCIEYHWCTKMTVEEFNAVLALADSTQDSHSVEDVIKKIAPSIKSHSDTEMSLLEIAGEIYRNAAVRYVAEF